MEVRSAHRQMVEQDRCRLPCRNDQCSSKRDKNIHLEPDELPLRSRRRSHYRLSASDPVLGWVGFKSELIGERRGDGRFRGRLPVTWLGFCWRGLRLRVPIFQLFFIVTSGFGWTARSTFVLANAAFAAGSDAAFGLAARVFAGGWDASS